MSSKQHSTFGPALVSILREDGWQGFMHLSVEYAVELATTLRAQGLTVRVVF